MGARFTSTRDFHRVITMLISTLIPILLPLVAGYSCPEEEFGFLGGDLVDGGIYGVATWQECGMMCELITDCQFWSYLKVEHSCWVKNSDAGAEKYPGAVSGARGCHGE